MVYKKFIKVGDKNYGPYLYESYRDKKTGKVKKRYIAVTKNKERNVGVKKNFLNLNVVFVMVFLAVLFLIFFFLDFTGRSILEINDAEIFENNISGFVELGLKNGELLPADAKIIVSQNGIDSENLVSDLFEVNAEGKYFIEGFNLSGFGEGVGFSEKTYPNITFSFRIVDLDLIENETSQELPDSENESQATENRVENETDSNSGTETNEDDEEILDNLSEEDFLVDVFESSEHEVLTEENKKNDIEENVVDNSETEEIDDDKNEKEKNKENKEKSDEKSEEKISDNDVPDEMVSDQVVLTGNSIVSNDEEILEATVSFGEDFVYKVDEGKTIEIISVYYEEEEIGSNFLEINLEDGFARISTNYFINENFGEEFIKEELNVLRVNLSDLGIAATEGEVKIKLVYEDLVFAEKNFVFEVSEEPSNESLVNDTMDLNVSFGIIKQIGDLILRKNFNYSINLDEYFSGAVSYSVNNLSSIGVVVADRILEISTRNESGVKSLVRVIAFSGNDSLEQSFVIFTTGLNVATLQHKAIVNQPVKWVKIVTIENESESAEVVIPKEAENITVKTGEDARLAEEEAENSNSESEAIVRDSLISGNIILENSGRGFFSRLFFTGKVIVEEDVEIIEGEDYKLVNVSEIVGEGEEVAIEYETPAPISTEEEINNGKKVTISTEDEYNYTNILAYVLIPNKIRNENNNSIKIYHLVENEVSVESVEEISNEVLDNESLSADMISGNVVLGEYNESVEENANEIILKSEKELVDFSAFDLDEDGFIDYVEWNVDHLSNQTYEIIYITKAEHLDENYNFIDDVYEEVGDLDGNYSVITDGDYLRVTFEQNLTNRKDITIYARGNNSEVGVYRLGSSDEIARFENISDKNFSEYKIYLINLSENESYSTFDLRSFGDVEYDYVVDPEIHQGNEDGLSGLWHFNNDSAYGENDTKVYDFSGNGNNGTVTGAVWNSSGGILGTGAFEFDGSGDLIDMGAGEFAEGLSSFSVSTWAKTKSGNTAYIVGKDGSTDTFRMWRQSNDDVYFQVANSTTDSGGIYVDGWSQDGLESWHHVVGVYNGTNVLVYVNGVLGGTIGKLTGTTKDSISNFRVSCQSNWNGSIDEIAFYNRSLNDSEILTLYNAGLGIIAGTNVWNCSSSQLWANVSCWSLGRLPVAYDDVVFNGSGLGMCNITNNVVPQNLNSFKVDSSYNGANSKIHFSPLFAVGNWGGYTGSQEWDVWGDINISNGTMYVYGDGYNITEAWMNNLGMHNITAEGHGQIWKSAIGNITVGGGAVIDGIGLGFDSGIGPGAGGNNVAGAHGGYGGQVTGKFNIGIYGNQSAPISLGCGGETGSKGGGAIKLVSGLGIIDIKGVLNMTGFGGNSVYGSSGGSIWIISRNFTGDGIIVAEGVKGGGGGRVRIDNEYYGYTGFLGVDGGEGGSFYQNGRPGTFLWGNLQGETNYTWPGNGWILNGTIGLPAGNYTINGNLVVPNGTILGVHPLNVTASDNGIGVAINVYGNVTVESLGIIDGYGEGFSSGPGIGGNHIGGTHGGKGDGNTKNVYGSEQEPTSLGSGGDSNLVGSGAIKINSSGDIIINGNVSMVGADSGDASSSGGSIWLIAENIRGAGVIQAYGGKDNGNDPGASGGGRIALHSTIYNFSGKINNEGGIESNSVYSGSGGTVYINATNLISIGNISVAGFNGSSVGSDWGQRINITGTTVILDGLYNASEINETANTVDGEINVAYSDCSSYQHITGTFDPSATYDVGTCDMVVPGIEFIEPTPDNNSLVDNFIVNASVDETSEKYGFVDLDNSLVGWWRMENNANDEMSLNNGTLNGDVAYSSAGKFGGAYEFDGSGDYINVLDGLRLDGASTMTWSLWVKRYDSGDFFGKYADSAGYRSWNFRIESDSDVSLYVSSDGINAEIQQWDSADLSIGSWDHLVITFNNGDAKFFKNGQFVENKVFSTQTSIYGGMSSMKIGAGYQSDINGSIDDVMIFNRSLSDAEILALYNLTSENKIDFNYNTSADGNHSFKAYVVDVAGNKNATELRTVTYDSGIPSVDIYSPLNNSNYSYNILFNVSSSETATGTGSIVPNLDNSIISWWRMDDLNSTGGILDYMGINNGTPVSGAVQTDLGRMGKAFNLDGSGDYILIDNESNFDLNTNFSVIVWFKDRATNEKFQYVIAKMDNSGEPNFALYFQYDFIRFGVNNGVSIVTADYSENNYKGKMTQGVGVYNGTHIGLYLNGELKKSTAFSGSPYLDNKEVCVGCRYISTPSDFFNGTIDDVIIFNRSLGADEIKALYNSSAINHVSNLSDGIHTYKTYIQDLGGNMNSSGAISFMGDTIAPVITILSPDNLTVHYVPSIDFNVSVNDNVVGVDSCLFSLDDAENILMNRINSTFFSYDYEGISHGYHNLTVYCNDTVNNLGSVAETNFEINLADLTIPEVSFPEIIYSNSTNITVNISNIGAPTVTDVNISCYVDDVIFDSEIISNFEGQSSQVVNCTLNTLSGLGRLFNASVDPANAIPEANESNNGYSSSIDILQLTSLDTYDLEDDSENKFGWFVEEREDLPDQMTYFFANYTMDNSSAAIEEGECNIWFDGGSEEGSFSMSYNSSYGGGIYYYNRTFENSGNYSWIINCSKAGFENSSGSGVENIKIFIQNQSSIGLNNSVYYVNHDEDINLTVSISTGDIDAENSGYNISEVWAQIIKPDSTKINISLSGSFSGGVWNETYENPGIVGDYEVRYFANLANSFDEVKDVRSNFSVQNVSITIETDSVVVNTTDTINVDGLIRRTNGTDFWEIANNNFIMNLNGVTVSSDSYHGNSSFNDGESTNLNVTSDLRLSLLTEGSAIIFSDDYSDDPSDGASDFGVVETNSVGYYGNDAIFSWNAMTGSVGNITYNYSSVTEFYYANVTFETGSSESGGGANTSVWYGFDGQTWNYLNSTASQNTVVRGGVNISRNTSLYIMLKSDTNGLNSETPVTNFNVSYNNFDYAGEGTYLSEALNFPEVSYTVLRWDEVLNQGSIKLQLRESTNGVDWGDWSDNFTNSLDNDISSYSGDYLQFRAHIINGNVSLTPILSDVKILFFNATTNSSGGYSYNITIPTDSLGVLPLEVLILENSETNIIGGNTTYLTVWARTNASYLVSENYSGAVTNYSVLSNFTRTDTDENVNGTINIVIYNSTDSWTKSCSSASSCVESWLVPTNLTHGNYSVNISVYNESAYYVNSTNTFSDYLEETDTTGTVSVLDEVVLDYNPFEQYTVYVNATINNTGNAAMRNVLVYDTITSRGSGIYSVAEQTPCGVIWPGEVCNATMRVVLTSGASATAHRISWKVNFTNPNGVIGVDGAPLSDISYITISLNALMDISNSSVNQTIQHESYNDFSFDVQSTGTDSIADINSNFVEGNTTEDSFALDSAWVDIDPSYIAGLAGGESSSVIVNTTIPAQTSPGNYTGIINVTSSAGYEELYLRVEVPLNLSWHLTPSTNLSYNRSHSLNSAGEIGNFTIVNRGNSNFTMNISYTPSRTIDYSDFGDELFEENDTITVPGMTVNPLSMEVAKGENETISLWHKSLDTPIYDVGIDVVFYNDSTSPTYITIQEAFSIEEQDPEITNIWFILNGVYGDVGEKNSNITIKVRATDDYRINVSNAKANVTIGAFTTELNLTDLCSTFGQCDQGVNPKIANFTVNFTPTYTGVHTVVAEVYDSSNNFGNITDTFTVYGTTSIDIFANQSDINMSRVDVEHSQTEKINITINNTGNVFGYSPTVNFSGSAYINISNYSFSNLGPGQVSSYVPDVTALKSTPPGNYTITSSLRWRNPDNTYSVDSTSFIVRVLENSSLVIPEESLNYIVLSGGVDSELIRVNNTGNKDLTSLDFFCSSGTICDAFILSPNETSFDVESGEIKQINLSLIAEAGLAGGGYDGIFNVTDGSVYATVDVFANVPETYTWNATPRNFNVFKGAGQTGEIGEVYINNTGNMEIVFDISSSNESIIQSNVSTITSSKGTVSVFAIEYISPSEEGVYIENISIGSPTADPTVINITVNITVTNIDIGFVEPTNESPLTGVLAGDNLLIKANASYGGEIINESAAWQVLVGGVNCSGSSSSYYSSGGYWNINAVAPTLPDGQSYDLTLAVTHGSYGVSYENESDAVIYSDITSPSFNITRNNVNLGDNMNLLAEVTDNVGVDSVWAEIINPNGESDSLNLELSDGLYRNNTVASEVSGEYNVTYHANDSEGNENSSNDWFEVYDKYYWEFFVRDSSSVAVANSNITLYRPNSDVELVANITNSSGGIKLYINKRNYDISAFVYNHSLKIKGVNLSDVVGDDINFNYYLMDGEALDEVITLYRPFLGFVSNSTGIDDYVSEVSLYYEGQNYDSPLSLSIVSCSDWNWSDGSCGGNWSALETSRNISFKKVEGNSTGFEAYFLSEETCGTGGCQSVFGETTANCPEDCVEGGGSTTTITTGGGGGGGGGLTSMDLAKIEQIVKSYIDVSGVKVETDSIYKELFAGESSIVRMRLKNLLSSEKTVILEPMGDVKDFISFDSSFITLNPNEARDVIVKIVVPKFTVPGSYDGDIAIRSGAEEGKVPVTIKVLSPEGKLLDVKIQPLTDVIAPGKVLRLQVDLLNLGKTKTVDVQFDLQLIDVETGEIVTRAEEAFAVETSTSSIKNLTIPKSTPIGKYMIKGTAYYSNLELDGDMQASSIAYVNVDHPFLFRKFLFVPVWGWALGILAIGSIVGIYIYIRWREYQKKRFKGKVEFNKLPQASEHSAFVGMVAETGIRTFVDMNRLQMHTLIAGSTGSGKTVAAQGIIEEALLHKKTVIVFDPTAQWTGFLRKCEDSTMLKRFKYYGMSTKEARAFGGMIKTIHDPYEMLDIKKYFNRPGEIIVFNVSKLSPKELDIIVASTVQQIFNSGLEESKDLNTLIVYDEVHRLLPKFGGSGEGFVQLERGAREFRKWGVGLVLISQVLSDFIGEIKANIGTEIQMGTRYEGDLERVNMKYGEDILKSVVKEPIGTGMIVNAEYNSGKPYFISFRPLLHSTKRLSNDELAKYEKYFEEIEDIEFQVEEFKKYKVDTLDFELELKLTKAKVKEGQFQMADMYLEGVRPRVLEQWKKLRKIPVHLKKEKISQKEVLEGVKSAKVEREKYLKKNPQGSLSLVQEVTAIKDLIAEKKKKKKNTAEIEGKLRDFVKRIRDKGKIKANEVEAIKKEIDALKKAANKL